LFQTKRPARKRWDFLKFPAANRSREIGEPGILACRKIGFPATDPENRRGLVLQ